MSTPYHSHYWAALLTLGGPSGDIDLQHDELVARLEAELNGQQTMQNLWTIQWTLE